MSENEEKKIIVDEDWKSQVQAEKEQLTKSTDETSDSSTGDANAQANSPDQTESEQAIPIPPASFEFLLSSMATQAMFALGQFADPTTGKSLLNLDLAKHHIDMLDILQEKTKGNLSPDEEKMLSDALHQLRVVYVAVQDALKKQENQQGK